MKIITKILIVLSLFSFFTSCSLKEKESIKNNSFNILASTYPIYNFCQNILKDIDGVKLDIMFPSEAGCPHNHAITPQDMQKIAIAKVLVINGLGMEEFGEDIIKNANAKIKIINSSKNINNLISSNKYLNKKDGNHNKHDKHAHHHHSEYNPHIFASPAMASKMIDNIYLELSSLYPIAANKMKLNYLAYKNSLDSLALKFKVFGETLTNNKIVTQHNVFDYLAVDANLNVITIVNIHPGTEAPASHILKVINNIKENNVLAIFTEPQYSPKTIEMISAETKISFGILNPVSSAPDSSSADYYLQVMENNLSVLQNMLKSK